MYRRTYLTAVGTTASVLALAGCTEEEPQDTAGGDGGGNGGDSGDSDGGETGDNGGDGNNDRPDVEILEHEFYEEEVGAGVRGVARNNTDSELTYVQAEAIFLDGDGTQIGEGLDNVTDLAAGREWEFDCMYLDSDSDRIAEYELDVSTGL
ncbi:FxLYD domain-containing protein [Haloarchaeobius litoreus]|uniref:FxLYD domain-containing protein n=1 Tax=Haloarchaeobius litoreus TaxID=755306 RepID=A0ABD6DP41_9EURY|nr:FxLYD domain-containing protein [Haloarchaeobius litoreus]